MSKGFYPCAKETVKIKGKDVPVVQCMGANDFGIHADNIKYVEDAQKGLLGIIDRANGKASESYKPKTCKWYEKLWCKDRSGVK